MDEIGGVVFVWCFFFWGGGRLVAGFGVGVIFSIRLVHFFYFYFFYYKLILSIVIII